MTLFYLAIFAASLLSSFALTKYVRDVAVRRGWVAAPGSGRDLHSQPLPRLGGVAICTAFLLSLSVTLICNWFNPRLAVHVSARDLFTILLPGLLIFLLGIYDDLRSVGPYCKFSVQAIAAAMLYAGGLRILDLPVLFGSRQFPHYVGLPLTIVWVLAISNAFNLIDGLDGLAAGSALFSTLVVFVVALVGGSPIVSLMTILLAGAILGFLRFNFNPATIFLGDCGSLFIGFMLSALAVRGAQKAPTIIAVAIPVVSFGLPILETTLSVLRRFIAGRPVFTADREHIHHKLLELGLSHRQVVIVLYAVSALFALLSLFLLWPTGSTLGLVLSVLGIGIWVGVQHLGYLEFGEIRRVAQRTIEQRQIFINNLAIRRAIEELKAASSYDQIGSILKAAFDANDFDGFELRLNYSSLRDDARDIFPRHRDLFWQKPGVPSWSNELVSVWKLTLDLRSSRDGRKGVLTIYRLYSDRDLQLDINLLTSMFPLVLADALDRITNPVVTLVPDRTEVPTFAEAHAG